MIVEGPAKPAPSKDELIARLKEPIQKVMTEEVSAEENIDRVWWLRNFHKAYLYYRDLQYFAPALFQGLVDATGIDGTLLPDAAWQGSGLYDYTQNIYRGYCRKLVAVLGTRIPNAIAVPNDPSDEADIKAARAANNAAMYIRDHCELQTQILWLVFGLFNFGTNFWSIEWVEDPDLYGWKDLPQPDMEATQMLGGGETGVPEFPAQVPQAQPPKRVPRGALEIDLTDGTEVSVPLDTDGRKGTDACHWIRRERERHKSTLLQKHGDVLRNKLQDGDTFKQESVALEYGQSIRSAMASPIGIVRPKRENQWTEIYTDWAPRMYELVDDKQARQMLKENFPEGLRITHVKGVLIDMEARKIDEHWVECLPEPSKKIMCEPIGNDWIIAQDIANNLLNQRNETIERSNEPGFADATRVDLDAYQRRRSEPLDLIPALRPPGGALSDIIFRPNPPQFSEQIGPFRQEVIQTAQEDTGLLEVIWGGDTSDPTARQTELKTNAAIRQLSVIWVQIGKSLEKLYEKACKILADHEDGVLSFTKQKANQFGKFDTVAVVIEDLKGGEYHFEADEAIPMTWGQQRDLLMWMLDKPAEILKAWGLDDPLNIYEFKSTLGMPGMRTPYMDDRDKGMDVIARLLEDGQSGKGPVPGPPDPTTGQPGPQQASIQPAWEDNSEFLAKLARAYLTVNFEIAESNPQGFLNVQLWGQAHEQRAKEPPAKLPVKSSVAVALKGDDLGTPAVQAMLQQEGVIPPGVQVERQAPMPKPAPIPGQMMPPPGAPPVQ